MAKKDFLADTKALVSGGYDKVDLVNSGLEEDMVGTYCTLHETHKTRVPSERMRTTAFIWGIERVALN